MRYWGLLISIEIRVILGYLEREARNWDIGRLPISIEIKEVLVSWREKQDMFYHFLPHSPKMLFYFIPFRDSLSKLSWYLNKIKLEKGKTGKMQKMHFFVGRSLTFRDLVLNPDMHLSLCILPFSQWHLHGMERIWFFSNLKCHCGDRVVVDQLFPFSAYLQSSISIWVTWCF